MLKVDERVNVAASEAMFLGCRRQGQPSRLTWGCVYGVHSRASSPRLNQSINQWHLNALYEVKDAACISGTVAFWMVLAC
jgi:hypothetical protein